MKTTPTDSESLRLNEANAFESWREASEILERHNRWRRGEEIPMEDPKTLGKAIDTVLCELHNAMSFIDSGSLFQKGYEEGYNDATREAWKDTHTAMWWKATPTTSCMISGSNPDIAAKQHLSITFTKQNNHHEKKTHHHRRLP